jgi:hypothetical protein
VVSLPQSQPISVIAYHRAARLCTLPGDGRLILAVMASPSSARRAAGHRLSGARLLPPCSRKARGKFKPLRLSTERCRAASAMGKDELLDPRGHAVAEAPTVEQAVVPDTGLLKRVVHVGGQSVGELVGGAG